MCQPIVHYRSAAAPLSAPKKTRGPISGHRAQASRKTQLARRQLSVSQSVP